jgi:hypothetical protein
MSFSDCPIRWAEVADRQFDWIARVDHLKALLERHTATKAEISAHHVRMVLAEAEIILENYTTAPPPAKKAMMIEEYNVAWKEYLKWRHKVTE